MGRAQLLIEKIATACLMLACATVLEPPLVVAFGANTNHVQRPEASRPVKVVNR